MRVEKEGAKNEGRYVGGFFYLFDWTSKSRKKLFAAKSDLPGTYLEVLLIYNVMKCLCLLSIVVLE